MAEVELVTLPAFTVKLAEVEPCGIVMEEGTVAALALELASETAAPPVPAGLVRVTVPVPDKPLTIEVGVTERL